MKPLVEVKHLSLMKQIDKLTTRLNSAIAFDAGTPLMVNGKLWNAEWKDAYDYNLIIEKRAVNSYVIKDDMSCVLGKDGQWHYEPQPSSRTEEFKTLTRFDNVDKAFEFLDKWRVEEKRRLAKAGVK